VSVGGAGDSEFGVPFFCLRSSRVRNPPPPEKKYTFSVRSARGAHFASHSDTGDSGDFFCVQKPRHERDSDAVAEVEFGVVQNFAKRCVRLRRHQKLRIYGRQLAKLAPGQFFRKNPAEFRAVDRVDPDTE